MRAAFIPALPPSALLAGMIAPSFRLVNRFCVKSCFARAAAVSGRPRCARYGLGRRSLMSKGPCPLTARCGIGRLCGERRRRERCERLKGARNAPRRTPRLSSPGHAPPHRPAEAPLHAPAPAAVDASPRPPLAPCARTSPATPSIAPDVRKRAVQSDLEGLYQPE